MLQYKLRFFRKVEPRYPRLICLLHQAQGDFETAYDLLGKAISIRDDSGVRIVSLSEEPTLEGLRIILSRALPKKTHLLTDVVQRIDSLGLQPNDKVDFSGEEYPREADYSDLSRALIFLDRAAEAQPANRDR